MPDSISRPALPVFLFLAATALAGASDSMFTYQGHLVVSGVPVTGTYDFEFSLHDDPATGTQLGAAVAADDLAVSEGLFQVPLDFGAAAFDGAPRWLQVAVRDGASTESLSALSPRTPVSRTPHAIHALKADTATSAGFAALSGEATHAATADLATNANLATLADTATSAAFASDSAALGGQPLSAFATSGHTHTGATIVDGSVAAGDLAVDPQSLSKVTGGAAAVDTNGYVALEAPLLFSEANVDLGHDIGNGLVRFSAPGSGVDQSQEEATHYSGGSNQWQSFTAGGDGTIHQVDIWRGYSASGISSAATLMIRAGEGTGQPVLFQTALPELGAGVDTWQSVSVTPPVPVKFGTKYTIHLQATGSLHPLNWNHYQASDIYRGGRISFHPGYDAGFRTHITGRLLALGVDTKTGDVRVANRLNVTTVTLAAPSGDPAPSISSRSIPTAQGGTTEATELIFFHANDGVNSFGPDYITLRAPALRLQTYNNSGVSSPDHDAGSNNRLVIDPNGNVVISQDLTVNGQAYKPGGGSWATISDSRTKKNISTISGALERLLKLRGVNYQWKEPATVGAEDDSPLMGLVADEVEQVFPEWISRGPDGLRRLEIIGFEGLVVEALKELESRNDALSEENRELKTRLQKLEELEQRLNRLESQ